MPAAQDLDNPPLPLDHIVVMVDSPAYRDLVDSPVLAARLGRVKLKQTTSSLAGTYGCLGIAGTSTLVEFFDVAAPPLPGITGGLVFSYEHPGSIQRARRLLSGPGTPHAGYELVRRTVPGTGGEQPWYHLLRPDLGTGNPFLFMIAEVVPEYFAHLGAPVGPAGEMRRASYLDAAFGHPPAPEHALVDVTHVTVRLAPTRSETLVVTLRALGYHDAPDGQEPGTVLRGPDVTIRVESDPDGREGVREIGLALRQPIQDQWRYGQTCTLTMTGDGRATWQLTPPTATAMPATPATGGAAR